MADERKTAALVALDAMQEALETQTDNTWEDLGFSYDPQPPRPWPSTIHYVDTHCTGFYGLSVLAADKGTGKTLLATASSIEAAASREWQVVSFISEDDRDGYRDRFNLYVDSHPGSEACVGWLHPYFVGKGQTPASLLAEVRGAVDWDLDVPILTVIDSINSVVNLSGRRYLETLSEFGLWMMFARRLSGGLASFLVTSETNKSGHAKGEALPFWADVYLRMKKETENVVSMTLDKSRRTAGEGPMGKYFRKWAQGVFESSHEQPPLRVVGEEYRDR